MTVNDLLHQFVVEARDCLESISQRLLALEKAPHDQELLNDLFRSVHTLKGNCGLFEFPSLERVVHAGEDLLDQVRHGRMTYHAEMGDVLLEAMDFTADMVDLIERTGGVTSESQIPSERLATRLRAFLQANTKASQQAEVHQAEALPPATPPSWLASIPPDWCTEFPQSVAWRYEPEPECFFKGEDPWRLAGLAPGLKAITVRPLTPWPDLSELDCYRCNIEILGISDAPLAYLTEHFRYVPEQIAFHELHTGVAATTPSISEVNQPELSLPEVIRQRALQIWDEQRHILTQSDLAPGTAASIRHVFLQLLRATQAPQLAAAEASLQALGDSAGSEALHSWSALHHPAGGPEQAKSSTPSTAVLQFAADAAKTAPAPSSEENAHSRVLKVAQDKIDRLMDLIGEMVVAKNALPYLAQRAETVFVQRELAREIKAQYAVINRIAEDMQHAIMQVRMMPVGTVFQRFGRLVRDISKREGKEVQLLIEGEDTEADKNIIEALADPLIHIIRNSLDHGIETPDKRQQAGKPATGTIRVTARQESDRVIIEIHDDGAGIDARKVRHKAVERGLVHADKAEALSDSEAMQLIFLPGFSTAETVSDLSGRGVGMDVVRTAVERVNGDVQLHSQLGLGTTIRLSLPLSMAVTNVMIIDAGGCRFGVPMDLIVETVRVHQEDIHHFKQARTTVLRGRIVPLRALHELLELPGEASVNEEGEHAVLVVRMGAENMGLLVDHFHGATDIILKPLEGVLTGMTAFSGTALMGDGSVLMILNPKELMS